MYTPLDRATREIRLAHLAPSPNLDEQVSCSLHIVSFDESLYYEALSYVWGDPTITAPIQLRASPRRRSSDGAGQAPALSALVENEVHSTQWPVTTNLEAAMRYLRHESEVRILWIDAICIDQSNIEERNHQVSLMKTIYSNAVLVRIWLGRPSPGSDDAMAILKQFGQGITLEKIKLGDRLPGDKDLWPIIEIMKRPWWRRTWVRQELFLAERAFFHCGTNSLEWIELPNKPQLEMLVQEWGLAVLSNRFTTNILNQFAECFESLVQLQALKYIYLRQRSNPMEYDLAILLAMGRLCSNSDDRDSIYGFLGLMSERIAHQIKPNYNMSVSEVFQDAAVQLIACSNSLLFLSLTTYTIKESRRLSTWVPSWHALDGLEAKKWIETAERLRYQHFFSACAGNVMEFRVLHGNVLHLSGVYLDHIVSNGIGSLVEAAPTILRILEVQREWRLLSGLDIPDRSNYVSGGKAIDAFWRVQSSDCYSEKVGVTWRRCQSKDYQAYREWVRDLEDAMPKGWTSDLAKRYHRGFIRTCCGRRFFVTKKGYFGIGPAELAEGDQIYILAGGKVPLVLRPLSESQPNTFELVGDCYTHGVMDGEAVTEHPLDSVQNSWGKAGATAKSIVRPSIKSLDPDLPLRDFHDVFIV